MFWPDLRRVGKFGAAKQRTSSIIRWRKVRYRERRAKFGVVKLPPARRGCICLKAPKPAQAAPCRLTCAARSLSLAWVLSLPLLKLNGMPSAMAAWRAGGRLLSARNIETLTHIHRHDNKCIAAHCVGRGRCWLRCHSAIPPTVSGPPHLIRKLHTTSSNFISSPLSVLATL